MSRIKKVETLAPGDFRADVWRSPEFMNLSAGLTTILRVPKTVLEQRLDAEKSGKAKRGRGDSKSQSVIRAGMPPIRSDGKHASVVSLFSGCGGLDLGFRGGFDVFGKSFERLPFDIEWANDLNPAACRTYGRNISDHIHCGDIWELLDELPESADVVIGGFPCQDFSINGKRAGSGGHRGGLYKAMVEAVRRLKPKVFVAENVKGLLQNYNRESLCEVLSAFEGLGYSVSYNLYLAADYGVPQMRERVFFVGTLPGLPTFKQPAPLLLKEGWITSQEAIGDLEDVPETESINHIWSRAARSLDQGSRTIKADRPSDTIRAECHGNIQFHYKLDRRLSMREAARLQSFPDDFIFESKLRETERQVGNAVPPVLAWHVAKSVADCLK